MFAVALAVVPLWPIFVLLLLGFIAANAAIFSDSFCHFVSYVCSGLRLGFISSRIEKLHNSVQAFRQPLPNYLNAFVLSVIYQLSEIAVVIVLYFGALLLLSLLIGSPLRPTHLPETERTG